MKYGNMVKNDDSKFSRLASPFVSQIAANGFFERFALNNVMMTSRSEQRSSRRLEKENKEKKRKMRAYFR